MKLHALLLMLVALLALLLAGCNPPAKSDTDSGTDSGSADKLTIGVSIPSADHGWTGGIVYWANEMKSKHPEVNIEIVTASNSDEQVSQLETMMTKGMDALVVLAHDSAALTPKVKEIHANGVYTVSVDRGLTEECVDVYLAGDNPGFGRKAAEYMAEKLGGKGNILILEGMAVEINKERVNGFKEVISKFPGIKVLDSQPGEWDKAKAYSVTQTMLIKHPQVDAIWTSDDDMSLGAEKAIVEAGRKNIWLLGGGGMNDVVKRIMDGDPMYPATITYSPKMIADGIERCIADLKAGKKAGDKQENVVLPVDVITPVNAKDFYYPDSVY